jgi:acyl-CoA synthetase (NDP forming)
MLTKLFNPKSVCVIGASNKPGKIGYTIMENLLHYKVHRDIYPINIDSPQILGLKAYSKVSDIPIKELDLAIVCVPKVFVAQVLKDCVKKKTKFAIIISSGFKEAGDLKAEQEIIDIAKKGKLRLVGPNVLGMFDNYSKLDCVFLPIATQKRPKEGIISLVSQSGTVGAILIEQFEKAKIGLNKFVSYGNASDINECDFLEYLNNDKDTKIIAMYIEEIMNGKKFVELLKRIKKPIIILKAGKSKKGSQSIQSHTGNLAGDYSVYKGIFEQFGIINAESIHQLINYSKAMLLKPIKNVTIITNGGGYGILLSDALEKYGVPILELSDKTKDVLKKQLPFGVGVRNPIDVMGDSNAERYIKAISLTEKETDTYIVILLGQTTAINKEEVIKIRDTLKKTKKNVIFISTMDSYTELIEKDFIVFEFPENLAKAISINLRK